MKYTLHYNVICRVYNWMKNANFRANQKFNTLLFFHMTSIVDISISGLITKIFATRVLLNLIKLLIIQSLGDNKNYPFFILLFYIHYLCISLSLFIRFFIVPAINENFVIFVHENIIRFILQPPTHNIVLS